MSYHKKLIVEPGSKVSLAKIRSIVLGKHKSHNGRCRTLDSRSLAWTAPDTVLRRRDQSLLIVLQGLMRRKAALSGTYSPV